MLRWIEGFEGFGSLSGATLATEMGKKYTEVGMTASATIVTGRGGGSAMNIGSNQTFHFSKTFDNQATWIIGFAFRTSVAFSGTTRPMIELTDGGPAGTLQMSLHLFSDGLRVYRGSTLLETLGSLFSTNTWYYIEFKVTINNTGSYYVHVSGSEVMSDASVDTQESANAYADNIRFRNTEDTPYYDDIYILDGTGSQNNDLLGEMKVEALFPESDTVSADWSLSAGSDHYALVDEDPSDEDTTYVHSVVSTDLDLYNYEDIASIGSPVYGIQINTQARVETAVSTDVYLSIKSGSTVDHGDTFAVTDTDYKTFARIEEDDPDTSAMWISTAVNAAQFGIKFA